MPVCLVQKRIRSSTAPRDNSFDYTTIRHELTVNSIRCEIRYSWIPVEESKRLSKSQADTNLCKGVVGIYSQAIPMCTNSICY